MSFIIIIIGIQYNIIPTLSTSEEYGTNSVTVTVEWIEAELPHIMYYTAVSPLVPMVFTGSNTYQLTIPR